MFELGNKRRRRPSVAEIERTISEVADKYGYGDVWLYGKYYEGTYEPLDDIQIMLDDSQDPKHIQAFMGECWRKLGIYVDVSLMTERNPETEHILAHSKLIHHARYITANRRRRNEKR